MDTLEQKVLCTMDQFHMVDPGQTVIAAVSGGADSLCMLLVLYQLRRLRGFSLCVAHVNHGLRLQAGADEAFVVQTAWELGLPVHVHSEDVAAYAQERRISVETAGREVRYRFFRQLQQEMGDSVIATAHSANDSVESFLMHWMRGSGLTGLTGIRPVANGVIRPLIHTERRDIEAYCVRRGVSPVDDETNRLDDYTRNDVRHHVLPPILQRCKGETLVRTMDILADEDAFLQEYTRSLGDTYIVRHGDAAQLDARAVCKLPPAIQRRLIRLALPETEQAAGLAHIDSVRELMANHVGGKTVLLPEGVSASLTKGILTIRKEANR